MSSDPPSPAFHEALASENRDAIAQIIREAQAPVLLSFIQASLPDWVIGLLAERFDEIALLPEFTSPLSLPEAVLASLIQSGMTIPRIRDHPQVRERVAVFVVDSLASTPSLSSVLPFVDLRVLSIDRLRGILNINPNVDLRVLVGDRNFEEINSFVQAVQNRAPSTRIVDSEKDETKDDTKLPPGPEGPPDPHYVIEESKLVPESLEFSPNNPTVGDLSDFTDVKVLSTSRFGTVRLLKRLNENGEWEWFAAKYYTLGDVRMPTAQFLERFGPLGSVLHPNVVRIVGWIPPTKTTGPIVLTPYSPVGSLEDVLRAVREGNPPAVWCPAGRIRMIVGMIAGLRFLHSRGIVHREVKPSDLIVLPDGTIGVCGYLTTAFEEGKVTKASQVGPPTYIAPEVYDDQDDESRSHNPKTDVFSFALILYEILTQEKVFPPNLTAATIMRRAMSRGGYEPFRPEINEQLHPVLREVIEGGWETSLETRLSFDDIWRSLKAVNFAVFPEEDVQVEFHPAEGSRGG